ncbi:MAG: RNA 2',3'-cyclic phosphodiesterase [Pseudomonadota bacterium]
MRNNSTERLFFALWPDDKVRQAINQQSQSITQGINGKIMPEENWHITLAFLGHVDMPTKQCMQQIAATVQASRFNLSLDQLGYWPKPRILWLGATQTPDALRDLVSNLTRGLQGCGYCPDARPFQVHLTLMRKATGVKTLPPPAPVAWSVEDFCLVRSITDYRGARYQVIARWALN